MRKILPGAGVAFVACIWGSTFLIIKHSLISINPIALVTYRFWLTTIILAFITYFTNAPLKRHWKEGFILGTIMFMQLCLMAIGLQYTTASNAAFINGLFLLFVPLFGFLLFKRIPKKKELYAFLISLLGIWILTGGLKHLNNGDIFILLNAALNGLFIDLVNRYVKEHIHPISLIFQESLFITLYGLIIMFIFHIPFKLSDFSSYFGITYLAVFAGVIGFAIYFTAQKYLQTSTTSILQSLQLVFGAFFALTIGGEHFTHLQILGGLVILLSIFIIEFPSVSYFKTLQKSFSNYQLKK